MAPPSVELRPTWAGTLGESFAAYSIGGSDALENLTSLAAPFEPVIVKSVKPASSSSAVGGFTGLRCSRAKGLFATRSLASDAAFSSTLIGGGGNGTASLPFRLPFFAVDGLSSEEGAELKITPPYIFKKNSCALLGAVFYIRMDCKEC